MRYVRQPFHSLRLRGPLADDPTARVLYALLFALLIWFGMATIISLPFNPLTTSRLAAVLTTEGSLAAALILLRYEKFRAASIVYLTGTWLFATVVMTLNGGIRSTIQVFFVTLPISAAWLLGYRSALYTAAVCLCTAFVFMVFEARGVYLPRLIPGTAFGLWAVLVQACLIGAVPVAHVLRRLWEALAELTAHRQNLETLVQERTAELVQARDEAEAANRAKSVFLASMSHELRTPLNAILGFSTLLRESALTQQQFRDVDTINRSGQHLLALINDVLDMAKVEAGRLVLEPEVCEVGSLVREVSNIMRVRAEMNRLSLQVEGPEDPFPIRADAAKLRQILINLVGNAIQYTEQGSVIVRWDSTPVADDARQYRLIIEVEDTGIGIALEDQHRIFEPFVQAASNHRRKGTGLGLTITKEFTGLMGGTIRVDSAPGAGSCFRIEMPVERVWEPELQRQETHQEGGIELEPGQPEYRILVVENEPENWMVLERFLESAGFQVQVAVDGEMAVRKFADWRPHFIWMDLRLPLIDGAEASRRIRALKGGRNVKIAAVTASAFAGGREEARTAGMDDYLRKPYRYNEVFECMARHLGVRYRRRGTARVAAAEPDVTLCAGDLAHITAALRSELRDAITALDTDRISGAIQKIAERDTALGAVLARYASHYSYTPMLDAVGLEQDQNPNTPSDPPRVARGAVDQSL